MANILVVDDEIGIRELLSEILSDEGHSVITAENAATARAARAAEALDLVLLDIWMPDTDGVTLLKEWASHGQLTMPVIMMSGHATIDTAVEATRYGALEFLEKPIAMARLLSAVRSGLERGRVMRSLRAAVGEYGVNPTKLVWIMSPKHYLAVLTDSSFLTMDKLGEKATVLTGQLGAIDGIPVIMSSKLRDCDGDGIVQTDPELNTKSQSVLTYRPGVYVGYRRRVKIEMDRDVQKDMNLLVCSIRLALALAYGAGSLGYVRNV